MLNQERVKEIENQIKIDIEREFDLIKKELFLIIDQNLDMYFIREFIKHYPPKAIRDKAEILLDTLLNYFMKDVLEFIKNLDTEKQFLFFKENIRENVRIKALQKLKTILPLSIPIADEKEFEKKFPIISSVALSSGGIATAIVIPESLLIKTIPAASSLLASFYILKTYKNRSLRLKKKWKKELIKFLEIKKRDIINWISEVENDIIERINSFFQKLNKYQKKSAEQLEL